MRALWLLALSLTAAAEDPYAAYPLEEWCGAIIEHLISSEERRQIEGLSDDLERRAFLDRLFARFDPEPELPGNPFVAEHLSRYEYANRHFREGWPGWRSERGWAWILLGPPAERTRDPAGGAANQYPSEVWVYRNPSPRLPANFTLTFVDVMNRGRYRAVENLELYATALAAGSPVGFYMNTRVDPDATAQYFRLHPDAALAILTNGRTNVQVAGRMGPAVASAAREVAESVSKYVTFLRDLRHIESFPRQRPPLRERIRTWLGPGNLPVRARFDAIPAADGARLLVTFALPYEEISYLREGEDRLASLDVYVEDGAAAEPFEDQVQFRVGPEAFMGLQGEALIYQAGRRLQAGTHKVRLAIRDNLGQRFSLHEQTLEIADSDGLRIGTPILARSIESMEQPEPETTPFTLGNLRVVPEPDQRFDAGAELPLYLGLYRAEGAAPAELRLSYALQREGRPARLFPGGAITVGGGTQALTARLPTSGLPAGPYELEVAVEDRASGERAISSAALELIAPERSAPALPERSQPPPATASPPRAAPLPRAPAAPGAGAAWRLVLVDPEPDAPLIAATEARAEIVHHGAVAIDRVEFWRDGRLMLADLEAPYTCNLDPPPPGQTSLLEAVAYDISGTSRRETVLLAGRSPDARVEVFLVELEVGLTDAGHQPVHDVAAAEFSIWDEGVEQPIAHFEPAPQQPLDIAFLIDSSGSLEPVADQVREAALAFAAELLRERDRVLLVDFDLAPTVLLDLGQDPAGLEPALRRAQPGGGTALYDAVAAAVGRLDADSAERRSVVVVFTDGADRDSRLELEQLLGFARSREVLIYAIGFGSTGRQRRVLEALSGSTGGRAFFADDAAGIAQAASAVAGDLRGRYRIGYYPDASRRDGRWHNLEVRVARTGIEVHARPGYLAPQGGG